MRPGRDSAVAVCDIVRVEEIVPKTPQAQEVIRLSISAREGDPAYTDLADAVDDWLGLRAVSEDPDGELRRQAFERVRDLCADI